MEVRTVGVAGAGTMGSGIAQIACLGGFEVLLADPDPASLDAGVGRLRAGLEKGAERGRWSRQDAEAAVGCLRAGAGSDELAACDFVVEAAPERLDVKQELFRTLSEAGDPILASNTSSLSVTAIASAAKRPERVVGMHFFNPPPLMPLVEIVAGLETDPEVADVAFAVGERMGRTPIRATDDIGFLANRLARPVGLEALRLVGDRVATVEQVDRICRLAGFRMGPFELMDLVGIDVGFAVSKSFWEQSFHEPRWQPHPIQQRMVDAGHLGRKTGRGYHDYSGERDADPEVEPDEKVHTPEALDAALAGHEAEWMVPCLTERLADRAPVGFCAVPPLGPVRVVELIRGASASDQHAETAERAIRALGFHPEWIADTPGGVLGRIVCQLVNEACFAEQKRIGSADDINTALRLGFNHPRGPLEWGAELGLPTVAATLEAIRAHTGEEKYRLAPALHGLVE